MQGDIRHPDDIIDQLVAVLLVGVLHFVMDDERPTGILARSRNVMTADSYLAFTHLSDEIDSVGLARLSSYSTGGPTQFFCRSRAEAAQFFDGFRIYRPRHGTPAVRRLRTIPFISHCSEARRDFSQRYSALSNMRVGFAEFMTDGEYRLAVA
ncbi:hypothetical protein GZH49_32700 [Nocardia terpenica]|uniref:SAM-dependent methyltransferase n=1 Tax=Nocardia terpenica TaxID=455432 RepID=UPI002FE41445